MCVAVRLCAYLAWPGGQELAAQLVPSAKERVHTFQQGQPAQGDAQVTQGDEEAAYDIDGHDVSCSTERCCARRIQANEVGAEDNELTPALLRSGLY